MEIKSHPKYAEQLVFRSYLHHHHNGENVTESIHQHEISDNKFVSISHSYSSSKIDTRWVNISLVEDLVAITVILSVFPFFAAEVGGVYLNDINAIDLIFLVWFGFDIEPYFALAWNFMFSLASLLIHYIWTITGPLPIFAVKSYPANMGRKYAVVARINPREILSKSKPDVVLPKLVIQTTISFNKFTELLRMI